MTDYLQPLMKILRSLPEVKKPVKKLSFNEKLKWTAIILVIYFVLGMIPLVGLDPNWTTDYFEAVRAVIAGQFGSMITLGIGPIVTAGIILQLLVGVDLLPLDLTKSEDKQTFQGLTQVLTIFVALFEAGIYVFMGGLQPVQNLLWIKLFLVFQLFLGTILIMLLDELSQKWGFISGISLFIAAGVASSIMVAAFNPFPDPQNPSLAAGRIPKALHYITQGDPRSSLLVLVPIIFTIIVFLIVVYVQSINVEIPLSFGRIGGIATRWPLNLFYTGNIPVILTAALLANLQLWARLLQNTGFAILGTVGANNQPLSGLIYFLMPPSDLIYNILSPVTFISGLGQNIGQLLHPTLGPVSFYQLTYIGMILRAITYFVFMVAGSVIFSVFWVKTAKQDSAAVARQINEAGMQVRGFRSDPRVIELILKRYIPYLTVVGGAAVGALAAFADFTAAIGGGTGILLTVMIIYKLYQTIVQQHVTEMHPALKRVVAEK